MKLSLQSTEMKSFASEISYGLKLRTTVISCVVWMMVGPNDNWLFGSTQTKSSYLCTDDLYGPVRNAFDVGIIHYEGKWEGAGPWKWRLFWALWNGIGISRAQSPPTCPSNTCCPHQKHYAQGRINHRCIGGFMYLFQVRKIPYPTSNPLTGLFSLVSCPNYTYEVCT